MWSIVKHCALSLYYHTVRLLEKKSYKLTQKLHIFTPRNERHHSKSVLQSSACCDILNEILRLKIVFNSFSTCWITEALKCWRVDIEIDFIDNKLDNTFIEHQTFTTCFWVVIIHKKHYEDITLGLWKFKRAVATFWHSDSGNIFTFADNIIIKIVKRRPLKCQN